MDDRGHIRECSTPLPLLQTTTGVAGAFCTMVVLDGFSSVTLDLGEWLVSHWLDWYSMAENLEQDVASLPEDLPPVQPPSAGFIVQLVVVPGLIVLAIVAVWLLFGKLATSEQDWRGLVVELQHPNPIRRWKGAHGLAQMLKSDQEMGARGQHLSKNEQLAQALADELSSELKQNRNTAEELEYQQFLARTLGLFDVPQVVLPPLETAAQIEHTSDSTLVRDRLEVRKNALGAIAVLAERRSREGQPLKSPELISVLIEVSQNPDPLLRSLAAFTLGTFPQPEALNRLEVMLADSDENTRVNAAIGLARQSDVRALQVIVPVLKSAANQDATAKSTTEFEQFLALKNCLKGLEQLSDKLTPEQRAEVVGLLKPLATGYHDSKLRLEANGALQKIEADGKN